jgi:hypothetical protein
VLTAGRILHFDLRESRSISPLFISLHLPGPPASVLSGVISGATAVGPEAQPSASRVVVVRVPSDAGVSGRYLGLAPGAIAADLLACRMQLPESEQVDGVIRDFLLTRGLDHVPQSSQTALTSLLDQSYLDGQ